MKDFFLFYSLWIFVMVGGLVGLGVYWYKRKERIKAEKAAKEAKRKSVKTTLMNYKQIGK